MFDIGFTELMVIGVVALVVIGPERLPRVARTAGHLLGRFQRYVSEVKADINREIELSELKQIQASVEDAARSVERTVSSELHDAEQELRGAQAEIAKVGEDLKQTGSELNQTFAFPHMGTAGPHKGTVNEAGGSAVPSELASASGAAQDEPAQIAASGGEFEPSPQLELGLQAQPAASPAAEPRQSA
jgi:sec-independent protein translocase protein TatB